MRPKKKILLVMRSEQEVSVAKFVLETRGFKVIPATTGAEAIEKFNTDQIDFALVGLSLPDITGFGLVAMLKDKRDFIPMALIGNVRDKPCVHVADVFLDRMMSSADLVERIRVLSARKRGPRKGSHQSEAAYAKRLAQLENH